MWLIETAFAQATPSRPNIAAGKSQSTNLSTNLPTNFRFTQGQSTLKFPLMGMVYQANHNHGLLINFSVSTDKVKWQVAVAFFVPRTWRLWEKVRRMFSRHYALDGSHQDAMTHHRCWCGLRKNWVSPWRFTSLFLCFCFCLFVSVSLSVSHSLSLPVCLFVSVSLSLSLSPTRSLSLCLCLSVCLCHSVSLCVSLCLCLSVCLSLCSMCMQFSITNMFLILCACARVCVFTPRSS